MTLTDPGARRFIEEALSGLAKQRDDLEASLVSLDTDFREAETASVSAEAVRAALAQMHELYDCLQSYERKELVRLMLQRVELSEQRIVLDVRGWDRGDRGPESEGSRRLTLWETKVAPRIGLPERASLLFADSIQTAPAVGWTRSGE